jgi:3-hydroxyisobutyrate dehydrogenase-like beta-hydroxyacid dehydrogenase
VGADPGQFQALRPLLGCMGSDVLHCGPVGCGQVVKILNNMVLLDTVHALAQAFAMAERSGVPRELMAHALGLGSAASFALRLTGANHLARDSFPEKMFSAAYALKDMDLALALSRAVGLPNAISETTARQLRHCVDAGWQHSYYPVMYRIIARQQEAA